MKLIYEKKSRFARTARPQREKMALKLSSCSGGTTSLDRRSTTPHVNTYSKVNTFNQCNYKVHYVKTRSK